MATTYSLHVHKLEEHTHMQSDADIQHTEDKEPYTVTRGKHLHTPWCVCCQFHGNCSVVLNTASLLTPGTKDY